MAKLTLTKKKEEEEQTVRTGRLTLERKEADTPVSASAAMEKTAPVSLPVFERGKSTISMPDTGVQAAPAGGLAGNVIQRGSLLRAVTAEKQTAAPAAGLLKAGAAPTAAQTSYGLGSKSEVTPTAETKPVMLPTAEQEKPFAAEKKAVSDARKTLLNQLRTETANGADLLNDGSPETDMMDAIDTSQSRELNAAKRAVQAAENAKREAVFSSHEAERDAIIGRYERAAGTGKASPDGIAIPKVTGKNLEAVLAVEHLKGNGRDQVSPYTRYMTDTEKNTMLSLAAAGDWEGADEYFQAVKDKHLLKDYTEAEAGKVRQMSEDIPALGVVHNVISAPAKAGAFVKTAAAGVGDLLTGKETVLNPYDPVYQQTHFSKASEEGVTEAAGKLGEKIGAKLGGEEGGQTGRNIGQFLAGSGLSMANMGANALIPGGLLLMSAEAGGDTAVDTLKRGATAKEATMVSAVAGTAEYLTEKIPFDEWLDLAKTRPATAKAFLANTIKSMGSEAAQEMITEVVNNVTDQTVMKGRSEFDIRVRELMAGGMNEKDARSRASKEFYINNVLVAGAGGALVGGLMGVGSQAVGAVTDRVNGKSDTDMQGQKTVSTGEAGRKMKMEDFANPESTVWNNVPYEDTETKTRIMRDTHDRMMKQGDIVYVQEKTEEKVEKSFPDLRTIKKAERNSILKQKMTELKNDLRGFLRGIKGSYEFEVNGNVLEATLYDTGIKEVLEKVTKDKASMLYHSAEIFRKAQYMYSTPDYDGDPNVYRWNYFYAPVQISEGEVVGVRIAVRDMATPRESQIYSWGTKKDTTLGGVQRGDNPRILHGASSEVPLNPTIAQSAAGVKSEYAQKAGDVIPGTESRAEALPVAKKTPVQMPVAERAEKKPVQMPVAGADEQGQKTVSTGETGSAHIDDNPVTHTAEQLKIIREYQADTDDTLKEAFTAYLENPKKEFSRHNISSVTLKQAQDASRLLGGKYEGYKNAINSNGILHILISHGPNGSVDHSMADLNDAARMGYVLENYDDVEVVTYASGDADMSSEFRDADNNSAPMLKYSKRVDGTYYIVEAIPESKYKKFWVVSAYMEKADGGTQAPDANGPENTPKASLASSPSASGSIVPHPAPESKAEISAGAEILPVAKKTPVQMPVAERAEKKPGMMQTEGSRLQGRKNSPTISKKDLRNSLMGLYSVPEGRKAEIGKIIDQAADRMLKSGALTEQDRTELYTRLYEEGVVDTPADQYAAAGRQAVAKGRIYVNDIIRGDFGEDWTEFRKRAFGAGVYLTADRGDAGVDVWNMELAEAFPGIFDATETDGRTVLENIVRMAEDGKSRKMSLAEYTSMLAREEGVSESDFLDNMERQTDEALRIFAEKAGLEVYLKDRTDKMVAAERTARREVVERQRERKALKELQQKTLKQLRWLSKNRNRAPGDLKATIDEVLGDLDIYAVGAAREMQWSEKYQATWKDLADMYDAAPVRDPNFLPSKELEKIAERVRKAKLEDLDADQLQDIYKMAVGLRTEWTNRNRVIGDTEKQMMAEVYTDSVEEIRSAEGGYTGGKLDRFFNKEHLTPMNYLERLAGWKKGTWYSMAKQLEAGERAVRDYHVRANQTLNEFVEEHEAWFKKADGQGKDAVWYEVEVPELVKLEMGDKPIFGDTVKVYMTPLQKVELYLESKNYDNLRHMTGGRTFVDKELYSKGKRQEALAQGTTIKLAPETVKRLVSDLTPEERALARVLDDYYNKFAPEKINRVSNIVYGYDKAITKNYVPIITDKNYVRSEIGIYDMTAEGVGHMKSREQYAVSPSYNISALEAFNRHVDQTALFVGMTIPKRNFENLLNWRTRDTSMSKVLTDKWGKESKVYIEDLLKELQGDVPRPERTVLDEVADTALSNYIASVFGFNPSIVLKQAMSFPLAATYLGWENTPNLVKAMQESDDLIDTYTSELAYRLMGYATPETAKLTDNPTRLSQNKALRFTFGGGAITAMDGWTVKSIWSWAENKVKRTQPDLTVGTREQIEAGESPFYKQVAKEFEEAVSRSQPMYDVMHRADIMRKGGKTGLGKALTMFKTVPLQQYNMLRETIGEARAAKMRSEVQGLSQEGRKRAEAEAKEASRRAGRAVISVIAAGLGVEAVNFLFALWKNKGKKYRDEDGELTWEAAGKTFLEGFVKDNAGMIAGGDTAAELIGSLVTGDRWYGIETPGTTQAVDVLEKMMSAGKTAIKIVEDGYRLMDAGGDVGEYLRRHGADYVGGIEDALEMGATYFGGIPMGNIKSYLLGAVSWMSPEVMTAYEDALATADKSGLKGLTGEPLRVRVRDILENRLGSMSQDTTETLSKLYEAGYAGAIPSDTQTSVSINGESRRLGVYEQQVYDTAWKDAVGKDLDRLVKGSVFLNADNATRCKMIQKLYAYGQDAAKEAVFPDFKGDTTAKVNELERAGVSAWKWAELSPVVNAITGDKDANGKTVALSAARKKKAAVDAATRGMGQKQRETLYKCFGISEKVWDEPYMLP